MEYGYAKPIEKSVGLFFLPIFRKLDGLKIFLKKGLVFLTFELRLCSEEQKSDFRFPHGSLKIEYTFIRYVPMRRRNPKPNENAPRPACP